MEEIIMKRHLAIMLALVLALMLVPTVSLADGGAIECVAGVDQAGTGWTWNGSTRVFTVSGDVDISVARDNAQNTYYGITLPADSTVYYENEYSISITFTNSSSGYPVCKGIYCPGDLKIDGGSNTGKLMVNTAEGDGNASAMYVEGDLELVYTVIMTNGKGVQMNSGTLNTEGISYINSRFSAISGSNVDITGKGLLSLVTNVGEAGYPIGVQNLTVDENVVIFASSSYSGALELYQSAVLNGTLGFFNDRREYTIPEGKTLTIANGAVFFVASNSVLSVYGAMANNGTITNRGKIYVYGELTGNAVQNLDGGEVITVTSQDEQLGLLTYTYQDWQADEQAKDLMAPPSGLQPDKATPAEELYPAAAAPVDEAPTVAAPAIAAPPQTSDATTPAGFIMLALACLAAIQIFIKRKRA